MNQSIESCYSRDGFKPKTILRPAGTTRPGGFHWGVTVGLAQSEKHTVAWDAWQPTTDTTNSVASIAS